MRSVAAAAAAAFAALAGLVAAGTASGLDQWADDHVMPLAGTPGPPPSLGESVVPLLHAAWHPAGVAIADVITLPGQVAIAFLLVLVAAWRLAARGRGEAALAWIVVFVVAVAAEVLCRHTLTRPPLHRGGLHVVAFDSSWPSGHALRSALVAAALAVAWPRLRVVLCAWLAAVAVLLVLAGFHTPTDVLGGLLLAALAAAGASALERSGLLLRGLARLRRAAPRPAA